MRRQLQGLGLILFGLLLAALEAIGGVWFPIIDTPPLDYLALISGILGVVLLFLPPSEGADA